MQVPFRPATPQPTRGARQRKQPKPLTAQAQGSAIQSFVQYSQKYQVDVTFPTWNRYPYHFPETPFGIRRKTSRTPPINPVAPSTNNSHGDVCNHLSRKYPINPPMTTAPTNVNGNSNASADCAPKSCTLLLVGLRDVGSFGPCGVSGIP